ncbi:hypothetical protein RFI_05721 [Reticulomyxa filosa]|uniref:UBR-type domain-containing protein n=1 Tax=Reticulomyxa filosa TaxID=46433 RepID=X6NYM4_RETFI|nr:hypothetical protein RFI_05721 [Reticulomyxa filosa]|eukprot:ETO31395.1 hypothetical protein RFI_05721 [Reticulomyxa filosa]
MSLESILQTNFSNEEAISLSELLEAQTENEKVAQVLSTYAGEERLNECTYTKGYLTQPVYACLTCMKNDETNEMTYSGVCLGCAMNCHLQHDIVELWEKRHFRCDCGNEKFRKKDKPSHVCEICPIPKDPLNDQNKYNENFIGKYCYCRQGTKLLIFFFFWLSICIFFRRCQDWFHDKCVDALHTKRELIASQDTREDLDFVCRDCAQLCSFLWQYRHMEKEGIEPKKTTNVDDKLNNNSSDNCLNSNTHETHIKSDENLTIGRKRKRSEISQTNEEHPSPCAVSAHNDELQPPKTKRVKQNLQTSTDNMNGEVKSEDTIPNKRNEFTCITNAKLQHTHFDMTMIGGGIWLRYHWLDDLCECNQCKELYKTCGCFFLIENEERMEMLDFCNIEESHKDTKEEVQPNLHNKNEDFSMEALGNKLLQRLPREQILQGIRLYGNFVDNFTKTLKKYIVYKKKNNKKQMLITTSMPVLWTQKIFEKSLKD